MTPLETLFELRKILLRNPWTPEKDTMIDLINACIKKRPQNDPDSTEPLTACPDERPAQT